MGNLNNVITALTRSFSSLSRPGLWRYVLAPAILSLVLWLSLASWMLPGLHQWFIGHFPRHAPGLVGALGR